MENIAKREGAKTSGTGNHSRDVVIVDIAKTDRSLFEVLAIVDFYKADPMYRDYEIYLDGDRYAIVAHPKGDME